jgi:hypothetical protein
MKKHGKNIVIILFLTSIFIPNLVNAYPSGNTFPPTFEKRSSFWYDSWGINRNAYYGEDGYIPNMFYETIGDYSDLAYKWGLEFKLNHIEIGERAQAILRFVQEWTLYGYDEDNVFRDGEAQLEWAWNGDEMAHMIENAMETMNLVVADCEDVAFLCATIYYGAGFDVAILDAPGHAALLIWLPDYPNANMYWDIHDGRGFGWIWVEATGKNNPLGWTPPSFSDGDFTTYPIVREVGEGIFIEDVSYHPLEPSSKEEVEVLARVITTTSQVIDVAIIYSVNNGEEQKEEMLRIDDSRYEVSIPGQKRGSEVVFHVQAVDDGGETSSSGSFSYEVKENVFGVEPLLFYAVIGIILIIIIAAIV